MTKTIKLFLILLLLCNIAHADIHTTSTDSPNYLFRYINRNQRGWDDTYNSNLLSVDSALKIISSDSDERIDILSADVGLISDTVVIISEDLGLISATVVIISNDAVVWDEAGIIFLIDGGGSSITADGSSIEQEIPFDCTIQSVILLGTIRSDATADLYTDIWKAAYADYPPTNANSITGSTPIAIVNGTKSQDTTLTGWTTAITKGDILKITVDSATTDTACSRATLSIKVNKD